MIRSKTKVGAAAGTLAAALGVTFTAWTLAQAATSLPSGNENTSIIVQNVGNAPADFIVDYYLPNGTRLDASDSEFDVPTGGTRVFAQAINSDRQKYVLDIDVKCPDEKKKPKKKADETGDKAPGSQP